METASQKAARCEGPHDTLHTMAATNETASDGKEATTEDVQQIDTYEVDCDHLSASYIYVSGSIGRASFDLTPEELGEIDFQMLRENGSLLFSVESTNAEGNQACSMLELKPDEAVALGRQLTEIGEDLQEESNL